MTRPTQAQRVLGMLRAAGANGITQLEVVVGGDGGPPVLALSQRIGDLVRDGHPIESRRERTTAGGYVARYVLTDERMRGTVGPNPPETSCQTTEAQPEEYSLVHSTARPGNRA